MPVLGFMGKTRSPAPSLPGVPLGLVGCSSSEKEIRADGLPDAPINSSVTSEAEFLETCHRCGNCIKNCPANAILPLQNVQSDIANTPYIDPDEQPCVICDSLACMYVCPSGALKPVYAEDIRIGLAVFNVETCLRTKEVACTYCIDTCPIGADAIHLTTEGVVEVLESGCTGCGVCQYACPTFPKSIIVELHTA